MKPSHSATASPGSPAQSGAPLGFGLGLRTNHYDEILSGTPRIDWFEAVSENYLVPGGRPLQMLERIRARFPVVLHGVSMSIGSTDPLDMAYLRQLKALAARVEPAWVSDHLCWTGVGRHNLHELAELTVNIFRTQFIAVAGNVLVAFPVAAALAWWWLQGGEPLASPAKAQTLLTDLDPFRSLALFHAAIAGVCLFLAGLISGYYDNRAVYRQLAARIEQHPGLQWLSGQRRQRLGRYLEHNLGALAGNFYFGLMLGSIGTLGIIFGLPVDIRHVTFSTANLAFAAVTPGLALPLSVFLTCLLGVGLIGAVNVLVSFSLALLVAMRARGVRFREWGALARLLWQRLVCRPRDFFWPPSD